MGNAFKSELTAHEVRLIAVTAAVDPRTVSAYFRGHARSTTSVRIRAALLELGFAHLVMGCPYYGDDPDPRRGEVIA